MCPRSQEADRDGFACTRRPLAELNPGSRAWATLSKNWRFWRFWRHGITAKHLTTEGLAPPGAQFGVLARISRRYTQMLGVGRWLERPPSSLDRYLPQPSLGVPRSSCFRLSRLLQPNRDLRVARNNRGFVSRMRTKRSRHCRVAHLADYCRYSVGKRC